VSASGTAGRPQRRTITVYSTPGCHLCAQALAQLTRLQDELSFELLECDITTDDRLHRAYFERIPVGVLDGQELFEYFPDERIIRERLAQTPRVRTGDGPRPSIL
jgi:glutaredoxin